ncbi:hypothetical protein GS597_16950 [Synechococcales cyanobacterium C]|uniref:Uncharacterized protein n=1 Tax=Petrachloros mirabilis ULC683 TaxID=2781853 RepID=A0A8K2A9L8_9CYAN|nr:hypothetical protein [Petrachloros mirabilis]NCJ08165.1 hypothetical protein [Petrachloros mirabilis ULC683]
MNRKGCLFLLGSLTLGGFAAWGVPALASTLILKVYPTLATNPTLCPTQVIAYQTARPYQEGSYATDGMVQLAAIATDIGLLQRSPFSATWTGRLKPQYRNCQATAGITTLDGEPFQGHSYLRLQLNDGRVAAILDMTGVPDANSFTSTLLFNGMREGNPRWAWGGSD